MKKTNKENKPVNLRVYPESQKRLKIEAAKAEMSMIDYFSVLVDRDIQEEINEREIK